MHRKDIEQIFKEANVCHLGMFDGKMPYIVPLNFGYKDNILYFHSALSGRKIDILNKNPDVCFEIDISGEPISSDKACNWSIAFRSVMGEGRVSFIDDENKKAEAVNIIMGHYSGNAEWDFNRKMLAKTSVFMVIIDNISTKRSGVEL